MTPIANSCSLPLKSMVRFLMWVTGTFRTSSCSDSIGPDRRWKGMVKQNQNKGNNRDKNRHVHKYNSFKFRKCTAFSRVKERRYCICIVRWAEERLQNRLQKNSWWATHCDHLFIFQFLYFLVSPSFCNTREKVFTEILVSGKIRHSRNHTVSNNLTDMVWCFSGLKI